MENKGKTGVFLTGGGAIGSFHIGAFKAFEQYELKPDYVFGCSVGAIIAGAATYLNADEMFEKWKDLTLESVFKVDSNKINDLEGKKKTLKLYLECFKSCSKLDPHLMIEIEDIRKLLYKLLDGNKIKESNVDFGISTTLLPSLKMVNVWKEDMKTNPLEYILASMYLPIFSRQKIIDNKSYMDLCRFRRYPLEVLKEKDCDRNIFINIEAHNINKVVKPMNDLYSEDETIFIDYEKKPSILDFTEEQAKRNFQNGYDTTMKVLSKKIR